MTDIWVNEDFHENLGLVGTVRPKIHVVYFILWFKRPGRGLRRIEICLN